MTALALAPRGLTWSVLRVHRTAFWIWTAFVTAGAGGLLWLHRLIGEAERGNGPCGTTAGLPDCVDSIDGINGYTAWAGLASGLIAFLPFVVAAFAGGALIGRELEHGTAALSWTQSVTPVRWLAAKLAVPALLITTGTALLTLLLRRIWTAGGSSLVNAWYSGDVFRSTGPVAVAYALLGLAVGALSGLLMRRTLPALGFASVASLLAYILGDWYRSELWPKTTWTGMKALNLPESVQQFDRGIITAAGRTTNDYACVDSDSAVDLKRCMAETGATDFYAVVHPASHYWPIQLVETGVVLTATALAVAAAFWLLRRRTP